MNLARHYDDETILALLESGDSRSVALDAHLSVCASCAELAETLKTISGALVHDDVWDLRELDEKPSARTISNLRAFVSDSAREDAAAEAGLKDVLTGDRETWAARLRARPELRTAGMVRKLLSAADRALDTMPPDAVAITALATETADALAPAAYPSDTVAKLRGAAWRDRAYALFYVGSYPEAESAIARANSHFAGCAVADYERGRVAIVEALIHRAMDRDGLAAAAAGEAVALLRPSGDVQRYVSAVMVQAHARMKAFDYRGALDLLHRARSSAGGASPDTHARLLSNIGLCQRTLGDFSAAIDSYRSAAILFADLGVVTEAVRTRAEVAIALRDAGRLTEAEEEMHAVRAEFERLGMSYEVALAGLVLAEIALVANRYVEVELLCAKAMDSFRQAGVAYGQRAMTALAYLAEAARHRSVTPAAVRQVHTYLRRLPVERNLLFVPVPG